MPAQKPIRVLGLAGIGRVRQRRCGKVVENGMRCPNKTRMALLVPGLDDEGDECVHVAPICKNHVEETIVRWTTAR